MDRIKDNISLDHMARLLVDVQQDSSGIVDSIISQHQRELLNLIFLGDAPNRNKVLIPRCYRYVMTFGVLVTLVSSPIGTSAASVCKHRSIPSAILVGVGQTMLLQSGGCIIAHGRRVLHPLDNGDRCW